MTMGQHTSGNGSAITCWQGVGNRRYLRVFRVAGRPWTAVLSWYIEQEGGPTTLTAFWLLRLGPGMPCNLDVPVVVVRTLRFLPTDWDRSTPTPRRLQADAETTEIQHALSMAESSIETELSGQFEALSTSVAS